MKATTILSEAWRNVRTGTTRAVLLAVVLAAAGIALVVTDMLSIVALEHEAEEFRDSGAAIRTLSAEAYIDADSCTALAGANTVQASGALTPAAAVTVSTLPSGSIPAFTVSPSFASVLGLDTALEDGVWIPESLATTLHAGVGTILETTAGPLRIAGVYDWPDDGRDSRLNYAFLVPDATRTGFDECWALIWPTSVETEDLLRFAGQVDSPNDVPLALSQVNKSHGTSFDGNTEYHARITQHTVPLGALIGLLIAFTGVRLRRLEYAGALHAGQRKTAALATALVETVLWAGAALLVAAATVLVTAQILSPGSAVTIAATGIRTLTATAAGALVGTVAALSILRESHLFRYFKDR